MIVYLSDSPGSLKEILWQRSELLTVSPYLLQRLRNAAQPRMLELRTLASPTLGNVSMVMTISSPVWFCSWPLRIRAAVYVVTPIPETPNTGFSFLQRAGEPFGKQEPLGQQLLTKGEKQVRLFHDGVGLSRVMGTRRWVLHNSPSPRKNRTFLETLLLSFLSSTNCRDFWACDLQNSGFSSSTTRVHRQKKKFLKVF